MSTLLLVSLPMTILGPSNEWTGNELWFTQVMYKSSVQVKASHIALTESKREIIS